MLRDDFIARVSERCQEFLEERHAEVTGVSADGAPLVTSLLDLTGGGKKLRPQLAWIGWRGAGNEASEAIALTDLGVALELFQAAALVHDDVIDRSDTRRGQPAAHRRFEDMHRRGELRGDAEHFGTTGAILAGDLALAWAGQAFASAEVAAGTTAARGAFQQMHTEVITGQYLDVLAEVSEPAPQEAEAVRRARTVLRYKAAKYSTEYPVVLGCALAGGDAPLQRAFAAAALPAGEAFQLRDDLLGVFGDPAATGKPVGDDLREGKRTELIAYGLFRSTPEQSRRLEGMLGDPDLCENDILTAREILDSCGAVREVERAISALAEEAEFRSAALHEMGVSDEVLADFAQVRDRLITRTR